MHLILSDEEIELAELLNRLAFESQDYVPEVLQGFREKLANKGYKEPDICQWRKLFLELDSVVYYCEVCKEELILEYSDLVKGDFVCPSCSKKQEIVYRKLTPQAVEPNLFEMLSPESDFQSGEIISNRLSNEELSEILTRHFSALEPPTRARIMCRLVLRRGAEIVEQAKSAPVDTYHEEAKEKPPFPILTMPEEVTVETIPVTISLPEPDIRKMSDTDILEALAFHRSEYSAPGIKRLEQGLLTRKLKLTDVDDWREGKDLDEIFASGVEESPVVFGEREINPVFKNVSPLMKPATESAKLTLGLMGSLVLFDALIATQFFSEINVFSLLWPDSPLGSGYQGDIESVFFSLTMLKAGVIFLALPFFIWWLIESHHYNTQLGGPPPEIRRWIFWGVFFIPLVNFYVYYKIARKTLRASATAYNHGGLPLDEEFEGSFPTIWEFILFFVNPSILVVWGSTLLFGIVRFNDFWVGYFQSNSTNLAAALLGELIIIFSTAGYVWVVTEGQGRKRAMLEAMGKKVG